MIHALVLAAGESRRMGMPKPLLRFGSQSRSCGDARPTKSGDTTFLERIIGVLRDSDVDGTTVVLGARADTIQASVDLSGVDVAVNEDYRQGQLSSLIKGLKSLPAGTEAILLCLVDHPFITTDVVNRLIGAFRETHRPIVLPVVNGRRGHPALFARSLFDELAHAPQDKGARHVVSANEDRILEVDVPDRGVLTSIDTPADYRSCFGEEPQVVAKEVMIELKEALQIVLDAARPLGNERVDMEDALNRILAEDIPADADMPPFDRATVDGYACRRADLGGRLTVIETIPAGTMPAEAVGPNQCAKIMTGAAVPQGADCVVMVEQTEAVSEGVIRFTGGQTGDNISRRATFVHAGQVILQKGSRLGPAQIAILAAVGHVQPLVAKRPKVAVIASGDELVAPAVAPGPSQIRNSNGPQLLSQLRLMGVTARDYGVVRDVESQIDSTLKAAMAENDVIIISGGVSMGDFDFVPAVLRRNNVQLRFEKVAVKPGKPTVFGQSQRGYCFGLPGNPVSTFVVFELMVKPFLYRLMGHDYSPVCVAMSLDEPVTRKDTDRQAWVPVRLTGPTDVRPVRYHGSGHILALCEADGLICMEISVARIEKGTPVNVRLLPRSGF
jgi:molybdopterin molybdotransferase